VREQTAERVCIVQRSNSMQKIYDLRIEIKIVTIEKQIMSQLWKQQVQNEKTANAMKSELDGEGLNSNEVLYNFSLT
jgi:hypothetical protein